MAAVSSMSLTTAPRKRLLQAAVPPNVAEPSSGAPPTAVPPTQPSFQRGDRRPCRPTKPHFRVPSSWPCHPTSPRLRRVPLDGPTGAPLRGRASARLRFGARMGSGDRHRPTSWADGDLTHPFWPLRSGGPAVFAALRAPASAPQMGDIDGSLWASLLQREIATAVIYSPPNRPMKLMAGGGRPQLIAGVGRAMVLGRYVCAIS